MIPLLIHQFFTYGIFVLSILANATFIFISITTHSDQIGRYRYLMILFAVTDVIVSITHLILMPGIQIALDGYIFYGLHLINEPAYIGVWAGIVFVIFFYQTFTILALHYIYRYDVVCAPRLGRIFKKNTTFWWSFIAALVTLFYTFGYYECVQAGFMPSDYKTSYYRPLLPNNTGFDLDKVEFGYLAIILRKPSDVTGETDVWQMDAFVAIIGAIFLILSTALIIFICSILILRELSQIQSGILSPQMRATQHQLLNALIVQTLIPCIFSYIPIATCFLAPCLGLDLRGVYGDLIIILTAVFPALDPIIMLYFVRNYRYRIKQMWRKTTNTEVQVVSHASNFTSGTDHSAPN